LTASPYDLSMKKRRARKLKDFVLPHSGNGYKPLLLTAGGVALALSLVVLVQGAYVLGSRFAQSNPGFLASVLPSVVTSLTNDDRLAQGLGELQSDELLTKAAQLKAEHMAENGYFSHVSPDGKTPWYWLDQVGYPYSYAGENLAVDFNDSKEVQEAWMASPTHRANIVKREYTRIGVGVAKGMFEGNETTFVVQFFATPKKGAEVPGGTKVAAVGTNAQVLGASTGPASVGEMLAQVAASPMSTTAYVLAGLAGLFTLLLLIAIVVHARFQFIEVIVGGLLVIAAALVFIVWNASEGASNVAPPDSAHASVEVR
jgi:uncharacterized protein YkwD